MAARTYKRNDNTVKAVNVHLEEISIEELVEKLQDVHMEFIRQMRDYHDLTYEENELLKQCLREKIQTLKQLV